MTCATCGHKRKRHQWVMDRRDICSEKGCDCSGFLPPRPVPEEGPEASYNVCKCGHREGWHHTPYRPNCTGSFGECPCFVFEFDHAWPPATVPAPHAEAEAAWAAWAAWADDIPGDPEDYTDLRGVFIAGYLRGRGDRG